MDGLYQVRWIDRKGKVQLAQARGVDVTQSGISVETPVALEPGTLVRVQSQGSELMGAGVVRHCSARGNAFTVGLSFTNETTWAPRLPAKKLVEPTIKPPVEELVDYYELLQISPTADPQVIHRVYHIMAARFHPDNAESGSVERFLALKAAYEVLSNPERRAAYDAGRQAHQDEPNPIFELKDFVEGMEGETNRRLGVLSLLYNKRRLDPDHPGVSLLDLEKRMNFPREHLCFTTWYLRSKGYVTVEDNSDFVLTAPGADYVEENWPDNVILQKLITGPGAARAEDRGTTLRSRQTAEPL